MRKTTYLLLLAIIGSLIIISTGGRGQEISSTHNIIITSADEGYLIEETIILESTSDDYYSSIDVYTPEASTINLNILIDNKEPNSIVTAEDTHNCDVTGLNIPMNESIIVKVEYNLPEGTTQFDKTVMRDTSIITVIFNGDAKYSENDLSSFTSFSIDLSEKTTTTDGIKTDNSIYLYSIGILVVIIIILLAMLIRKPKTTKTSGKIDTAGGSKEFLTTKKALLMELLKDIEKKHRAKQISDDTYNKLKDQYKSEAVNAMKKLEDIK